MSLVDAFVDLFCGSDCFSLVDVASSLILEWITTNTHMLKCCIILKEAPTPHLIFIQSKKNLQKLYTVYQSDPFSLVMRKKFSSMHMVSVNSTLLKAAQTYIRLWLRSLVVQTGLSIYLREWKVLIKMENSRMDTHRTATPSIIKLCPTKSVCYWLLIHYCASCFAKQISIWFKSFDRCQL